ncbi:MAG TPA: hypothetical protein PKY43_14510, partial [Thauera aminoaromatica]|nr:hypothetical protein [Thauera aminoaromatica]
MATALLRDVKANLGPMMAAITGLVEESHKLVVEIRAQRLPQQDEHHVDPHEGRDHQHGRRRERHRREQADRLKAPQHL